MANDDASSSNGTGWMSDVQRAIALILIGTFAVITALATARLVWSGDTASINEMSKTLQAALVNMGLIALGFFFGNTMAKMQSDAGQQKVVDKLTSTGSAAPGATPVVVGGWWSLLSDAERAAITAAVATDSKVATIVAAPVTGKEESGKDIAYLVSAGLLTQDRANTLLLAL